MNRLLKLFCLQVTIRQQLSCIETVFARPYNARAKVIERFFKEFQEGFEKLLPSYIGISIEDKPAWLKRGEKLHAEWHKKLTDNHIPTVSEASKYINSWIEFHNNQPCPNDRTKTIKECLNSVQKQNIDVQTFGYHHYQKFKDVAVLQKIFNHYSPQITMRYIGIDQDMIDDSYNNFIL